MAETTRQTTDPRNLVNQASRYCSEDWEILARQLEKVGRDVAEQGRWNLEEGQKLLRRNLGTMQSWAIEWQGQALEGWRRMIDHVTNLT